MINPRAVVKLVTVFTIALLIACAENPVDLPEGVLVDSTNQNRLFVDTLDVTFDTTYAQGGVVNTVDAPVLLMGRQETVEMRPIIKFLRGLHSANDVRVLQASFNLIIEKFIGDTTTAYSITVYPILKDWSDNTSPIWQDVTSAVDFSHPIGSFQATRLAKDTLTIEITDTLLVRSWSDSNKADENYGVFLDFNASGNFVIKFRANPEFRLTYMAEGDTAASVDSTYLTRDAYVIEGNLPALDTQNYNYLVSLFPHYMVMTCDLTPLRQKYPEGIIITSGNFILPLARDFSLVDAQEGTPVRLRAIVSDPTMPDPEIDSTRNAIAFNTFEYDSGYIRLAPGAGRQNFASSYLQQLFENPDAFTGFKLDLRNAASYYEYVAFRKRLEAQRQNRPRLIIYYWVPQETGN